MTTAEKQALKTDITVTKAAVVYNGATLLQHWNNTDTASLADYYNQVATPTVQLWKPAIPVEEVTAAIDYTVFATKTALLQNTFMLLTRGSFVNATNANIRNGFAVVFPSGASLTNLTALAKKPATNFENLFTTNLVSTTFGQILSPSDVYETMQS